MPPRISFSVPENGRQIKVAAIQGNVSSRDKFQISSAETVAIYEKLIREAAASGAQLIVTPESAFPWDLGRDEKNLGAFRSIATTASASCSVILRAYATSRKTCLH